MAFLDEYPVVVIGHEKGRETEERVARNFGMPHPSGFRKANRLMKLAEKFSLPLITLIDLLVLIQELKLSTQASMRQ